MSVLRAAARARGAPLDNINMEPRMVAAASALIRTVPAPPEVPATTNLPGLPCNAAPWGARRASPGMTYAGGNRRWEAKDELKLERAALVIESRESRRCVGRWTCVGAMEARMTDVLGVLAEAARARRWRVRDVSGGDPGMASGERTLARSTRRVLHGRGGHRTVRARQARIPAYHCAEDPTHASHRGILERT
ncbi:hypothetical protein EVG20_g4841 [Dentipellis fragilis]|uniref:Uncharacterized protein n=1 Tax=Dentipellis fragilis TaxID=205917 RepID=A0A4Y9YX71_9AGAM|nr:hypothetical protein EVG20_g4841 [Dentipellis fragilis]